MLHPALAPSPSRWSIAVSAGLSPTAIAIAREMEDRAAARAMPSSPEVLELLASLATRLKPCDPAPPSPPGIVKEPWIAVGDQPKNVPADPSVRERLLTGVFLVQEDGSAARVTSPLETRSPNPVAAAFLDKYKAAVAAKRQALAKKALDKAEKRRREREHRYGLNPKRKRKRSKKSLEKARKREEHLASLSTWEREKFLKEEREKAEKRRARREQIMTEWQARKTLHKIRIVGGQHIDGGVIADFRYPSMTERLNGPPWRSGLNIPSLMLFAASTPTAPAPGQRRQNSLQVGDDKYVLDRARSTALGRDKAYIQGHWKHIHWIAQDLDYTFNSIGELMTLLRERLPPEFLPHLIICRVIDGKLVRPHLVWLLPPGKAVWNDLQDERCRRKPIGLLKRIQRGLCAKLADIGADPGMMHAGRVKNPLSLFWSVFSVHDAWQSLDAWKNAVVPRRDAGGNFVYNENGDKVLDPLLDLKIRADELERKAALAGAPTGSNGGTTYNNMTQAIAAFMQSQECQRSPAFETAWESGDTNIFGEWMFPLVRPAVVELVGSGPEVDKLLMRRCKSTRRIWKRKGGKKRGPDKKRVDRGRDHDRIIQADPLHAGRLLALAPGEKKPGRVIAGAASREAVKADNVARLAAFIAKIRPDSREAGIKAARQAKVVSDSTIYRRYDEAAAMAAPLIEEREREEAIAQQIIENEAKAARWRAKEAVSHTVAFDKKQALYHPSNSSEPVNLIKNKTFTQDDGPFIRPSVTPYRTCRTSTEPRDWSETSDHPETSSECETISQLGTHVIYVSEGSVEKRIRRPRWLF
jgi:hypothetical protein